MAAVYGSRCRRLAEGSVTTEPIRPLAGLCRRGPRRRGLLAY